MKYKVEDLVEVRKDQKFHSDLTNKLKLVDYTIIIDEVIDWFEREDDNYYYSADIKGWVFGDEHIIGKYKEPDPITSRFDILDIR